MKERFKELVSLVFGSRFEVSGTGRTVVNLPMWLVVLAGLASPHLVVITALLIVGFGMRVRIAKA